jgi:excisionase family DNA binding protein
MEEKKQDLIMIGEASRILEVSDETVRRFTESGQLRARLAGKYRVFERTEVEKLARERKRVAEARA